MTGTSFEAPVGAFAGLFAAALVTACTGAVETEAARAALGEEGTSPLVNQLPASRACLDAQDERCCPEGLEPLAGTPRSDSLSARDPVCVLAGEGDDDVRAKGDGAVVVAGPGNDTVKLGGSTAQAHGGEGNDLLIGGMGQDFLQGGDGDDHIEGGSGDDIVFGGLGTDTAIGGSGNDVLIGGRGNDVLLGGRGNDILLGGAGHDMLEGEAGDDTFVFGAPCEIEPGDTIDGGRGHDRVVSPLTERELMALGLRVVDVEEFVVEASSFSGGGCFVTGDRYAMCDCCADEGLDPAQACLGCAEDFVPSTRFADDGGEADGPLTCEPVTRSCTATECGAHGTCVEAGGVAQCRCEAPYGGVDCDECLFPFELDTRGHCVLGAACDETFCSGEGTCSQGRDGEVTCLCPDGSVGCGQRGERSMATGTSVLAGSSVRLSAPEIPTDCGPVSWSIVSGRGSILSTRDGGVELQTNTATEGPVDIVVARGVAESCPLEATEQVLSVYSSNGIPARGFTNPQFEEVDEAITRFMQLNKIPGASVSLSHMGKIVYRRAFGNAAPGEAATPLSVFRIASVSKVITRAAIERLVEQGLLEDDLGDNVFQILQDSGSLGSVLGLSGGGVHSAPLALNEYRQGTSDKNSWLINASPLPSNQNPNGFPTINGVPCRTAAQGDGRFDPQWQQMTVQDLVSHRAGFNRAADFIDLSNGNFIWGGDLTYAPSFIMRRLPLDLSALPIKRNHVLQMLGGICMYYPPGQSTRDSIAGIPVDPFGVPLTGTDVYSNAGYGLLGAIVQAKTGLSYGHFVRENVLDPWGLDLIRLGRTKIEQRYEDEAYYYVSAGDGPEVYAGNIYEAECNESDPSWDCDSGDWQFPNIVTPPNGGNWGIDYRDAFGGWTATSCDLVELTHHHDVNTGVAQEMDEQDLISSRLMWGAYQGTRALAWQIPAQMEVATPTGGAVTQYSDLPTETVYIVPGFRMAAIFNRNLMSTSHPSYDPGLHTSTALTDMVGKALSKLTLFDLDFDETLCTSPLEPELPEDEYGDCVDGDGHAGCPCEPIDTFTSTLGSCAAGDDDACERSQPDGAAYDDRFCYGEDVVCGQTQKGNPICQSCGDLPGQIQKGCPCDVVSCGQHGLTCWGADFGSGPGRCWDVNEPPDHICIESCEDIVVGPNEYRAVCVTAQHGPYTNSPHQNGLSPYDHTAYCASVGCGGPAFCEEQIGKDDGLFGLVCRAGSCEAQCETHADCWDQGYPQSYACVGGDNARCVPQA